MDSKLEESIRKYMSELGKKGAKAKTPEQRRAAVIKGWETKRAKRNSKHKA